MNSDVRNYWIHKLMAVSVRRTMHHLYPRLLALHDLDDEIALPKPSFQEFELPSLMRNSHMFMASNGVYLIGVCVLLSTRYKTQTSTDNDDNLILWIGQSVSPQILKDLIDVEDIGDIDRNMV